MKIAISHCLTDWGTAADVPNFFGRDAEMATLSRWVGDDRCRLISILGMGGIGKSALAIRLVQTLQTQFDISCILLTSREKPQGIDAMEGDLLPVRTMYLTGLDTASSQLVLDQKGLTGSELEINRLIDHYRGHPLSHFKLYTAIKTAS